MFYKFSIFCLFFFTAAFQPHLKPIIYIHDVIDKFDEKQFDKNIRIFTDPKTKLKGYKNKSGKIIIPAQFEHAMRFNKYGIADVFRNEPGKRWHKINKSGQFVAQSYEIDNGPDYDVKGISRIIENKKVGYINTAGKIIIPPIYDWIGIFNYSSPIAIVSIGCVSVKAFPGDEYPMMKGGKWGAIDRNGKIIVPIDYDRAEFLHRKTLTFYKGENSFELYETSINHYQLIQKDIQEIGKSG